MKLSAAAGHRPLRVVEGLALRHGGQPHDGPSRIEA
jgi:hypothetical protein